MKLCRRAGLTGLIFLAIAFSQISPFAVSQAANQSPRHNFPLVLEKNQGQAPAQARYLARSGAFTTWFTSGGIQFLHPAATPVTWQLLGATAGVEPQGRNPLPSHSNYFASSDSSQWISNVENDSEVLYSHVYPGIDLVFHSDAHSSQLEHDFRIAPNADPARIAFHFSGAATPALDSGGNLKIALGPGAQDTILLHKPVAFQNSASGLQIPVSSEFLVAQDGTVRFSLGPYDHSQPLVIDPVFAFSTYLAGTGGDQPMAVTTDSAGNSYVTGTTQSTNFPLKNPIDNAPPAAYVQSIFVSSFDPTGNALRFSTYLGTGNGAQATSIAIDPKGNVLLAGVVTGTTFPHSGNLPALTCGVTETCFVLASLNSTGSKLNFAGEAGGSVGSDNRPVLASDSQSNIYLAATTNDKNFPITPGTLAPVLPGDPAADTTFVMKVDPTGKLLYATIVPSLDTNPQAFAPAGIVIDGKGQATIAGTGGDGLPTTPGVLAYNPPHPDQVGFLFQLNATASAINYATYLPGVDSVLAFTPDKVGNSWLTGVTSEPDLPTAATSYQPSIPPVTPGDCPVGFIMEVNPTGTESLAATYLGSTDSGCGTSFSAIALDSKSNVYVGGYTGDPAFPFKNPFTDGTRSTLALAVLNPSLTALEFGSLLGPPDYQSNAQFGGLTLDPSGNLIVVGNTTALDFPTTPGSFQPHPPKETGNPTEFGFGFVSKLDLATQAPSACLDTRSIQWTDQSGLTTQSAVAHLTNCGNAPLIVKSIVSSSSNFTLKDSCTTLAPGVTCPISITYNPAPESASSGGTITITDNAQLPTQSIQLTGLGYGSFPFLESSTSEVNFGDALIGASAAPSQISIINGSTVPIEIQSASVLGDFAITRNQCTGWLQYRFSSCTLTLAFKPTAPGLRAGQLTILGDGNAKLIVPLFGSGDSSHKVPIVTGLVSPTVQIGGSPQTITISGANFYPESVVKIGSLTLPTTYVSGGQLTAKLAPTALSNVGVYDIYVANPTPGGGSSNPIVITAYRVVPVDASALAAVPDAAVLYAAIPANARANPNTVVPITAATGVTGTPIPVGNNPALLSASSDGKYLYVANNGSLTVQRINLVSHKVEATFPYPAPKSTVCQNCNFTLANDLQAVPGNSLEVAVAFPAQVALYNSDGLVNYAPQTVVESSPINLESVAFAGSPLTLYGLGWTGNEDVDIYTFKLSSSGVTFVPLPGGNTWPNDNAGTQIVSDGTDLYTSTGLVFNPEAHKQVGTFPISVLGEVSNNNLFTLASDAATKTIYAYGAQTFHGSEYSPGLEGYRWNTTQNTGFLAFPGLVDSNVNNLVRFGAGGLAFLAPVDDPQYQQVFLTNSSVVAPYAANPKPAIGSIYPPSVEQDYAVPLLITGSGIQPDTQVYWNGAPIAPPQTGPSTIWLNTNAILVNLAQSSAATTGTFNFSLVNPAPGGGTSAVHPFAVTAPAPTLAISPTTLSFPTTTHGTKSAPLSIVLADDNSGNLTISSIVISGTGASSFSTLKSNCTTLGGGDSCVIQVVFQPTAAGTFTATLKIASNAPGSPQSITLTGVGK